MRFIRLFYFHVKDYLSDQYFVWLTITSTVSIFLVQYTVAYASHTLTNPMLWRQSGIFGLWTSCTTVAGCINFEQAKGTLPYLLNNQYDERLSLITLLLPASSYGLCSFPIAFILAKIFGVATGQVTGQFVLSCLLLWLAASLMGILIASCLTLTSDAMVYETLIGTPILLLAGLFGNSAILTPLTNISKWLIPLTTPVANITRQQSLDWPAYLCSLCLWMILINLVVKKINFLARKKGALKII
ncbi:multidrug ABC transporter permease [Lactobacillus sp. ESL0684]|uniref:multidrug ABC transporter permease n=1 Tax=unclassified Lactobacillus TaxID=2620435 RepID=UPI0023F6D3B0|nr:MULTISPECIES: multidrug ABC transporter permease [unclassified Lactobacillus]WEV40509.1 multidrug ABC transporter permease [Lactobacillus sp. ESL0681]WEV43038.1 multidrug ABC transporter permease [Lactobacillus sp. ESL0684]